MVVLAGLPPEHYTWAVDLLASNSRVVVGAPSSARDGPLYPARVIETLLKSAASFAVRRRSRGPASPIHPSFVTLLYVTSPDQEALLSAFDFAVLPVPLGVLGVYGERGRMLRHERAAVEAALRDVFAPGARANAIAGEVRQRVGRTSEADALLLPPANFRVDGGDLTVMFSEYRSGVREPTDRFPELGVVALNHDDLPRLERNEVRRVHVDERDLAFLRRQRRRLRRSSQGITGGRRGGSEPTAAAYPLPVRRTDAIRVPPRRPEAGRQGDGRHALRLLRGGPRDRQRVARERLPRRFREGQRQGGAQNITPRPFDRLAAR